jgi:hypothetical protein
MARMRSPNYPGISLPQAIELVSKLHQKNRTNAVDRESAAKDIGYSGLTGRTLKLIAALSQYELIEKAGKGNIRVSKTAVDILHGLDEQIVIEAKRVAGNAPPLFQRIFARFDDGIPSENAIRSYLIQEGFTDAALTPVLKSFMETNRFLSQSTDSESYGNAGEDTQESAPIVQEKAGNTMRQPTFAAPSATAATGFANSGLDFNFSMGGLTIAGGTNSKSELEVFIDKLNALKVLLPDDDSQPSEE